MTDWNWMRAMVLAAALPLAGCGDADEAVGGHDEAGHADDGHSDHVEMSAERAEQAGIVVRTARPAPVADGIELPAEIRFDQDRLANVTPRVGGIVRSLEASEGDLVEAGSTLALLDSRELADLKADYLSAAAEEELARTRFAREERLLDQGITSQADHDAAQQELARARARRRSVETNLHAVGVDHAALSEIPRTRDGELGRYAVAAPLGGTVIERSLSLGQSVDAGGAPAFVVADETRLWADIDVYRDALMRVRPGAAASLHGDDGSILARGEIAFVTPQLSEGSRTALARMVLDNEDRGLRPGLFLTARISGPEQGDAIFAPTEAVQPFEGGQVVFVPEDAGFAPRPVETGRRRNGQVEILSGLAPGEVFVAQGAFTLRAELEKSGFDSGHAH